MLIELLVVAKAFDILSDSNKRAIHDEGGDADGSRGRSSATSFHQQQYSYNRRQADDVSPEDLFNMFFGGGMRSSFGPGFRQQQQQQRFRQQQQQQQRFRQQYARPQQQTRHGDADLAGSLSQMMPIILISILAIFALLFSFEGEPLYTFRPSPPNTNMRTTKSNNINYYVNPKTFDSTVKSNIHKFARTERQIETEWLGELRAGCQSEQRHRSNLLAQADGVLFGIVGRNEKAYKKAENMKMKSCDELRRLAPKIRG
jgi:DnaJ family protein B protein 12